MASGDTLLVFTALNNQPPSTPAFATLDTRNDHPVLDFDASVDETAIFGGVLPRNYAGGGVTATVHWTATSATGGSIVWQVAFERLDTATDLDANSCGTAVTTGGLVTNATSGAMCSTAISMTAGAQMDSLAVGEAFRFWITRVPSNAADDMSGDAELHRIEIKET